MPKSNQLFLAYFGKLKYAMWILGRSQGGQTRNLGSGVFFCL